MTLTTQWLEENLPHGSGIDADWHVDEKSDRFIASNSFHAMDEDGFYDGWADFTVSIPKKKPEQFKLQFNGALAQRINKKYMLRDYLETTFAETLPDFGKGG